MLEILKTFFEAAMIILFGLSWPFNVIKSLRSKTAKGKSPVFLLLIFVGYICGVIKCLILPDFSDRLKVLLLSLYCLNLIMVGTDLFLYIRNKRLDATREKGEI